MARKGDLIVLNPRRVGGPAREAEIIEVIEADLRVQYRVRWNDGHESVLAPGAGAARIQPARDRKKTRSEGTEPKSPARKSTARKSTARKSTAKTTTTKKSTAKKSTAKTAKKSAARKSTVRKVAANKAASQGPSGSR